MKVRHDEKDYGKQYSERIKAIPIQKT